MAAVAFVALVLLVSLIGQSRTLSQRLAVYDARAAVLKQSIEEETERTQEIQELKEYMQTDAYVEEIAREKLGLVKDNEIVFIEED
jgi:cell division protein DivIC